jgi:hypothetical protein
MIKQPHPKIEAITIIPTSGPSPRAEVAMADLFTQLKSLEEVKVATGDKSDLEGLSQRMDPTQVIATIVSSTALVKLLAALRKFAREKQFSIKVQRGNGFTFSIGVKGNVSNEEAPPRRAKRKNASEAKKHKPSAKANE